MKLWLAITALFVSTSSFADLNFQMSMASGDWNLLRGDVVFRVSKQASNSIKVQFCDKDTYFNSANWQCTGAVKVFHYRADLDAFYAYRTNQYCSESLQVSETIFGEMLRTADPFRTDREQGLCEDSGKVMLLERLR